MSDRELIVTFGVACGYHASVADPGPDAWCVGSLGALILLVGACTGGSKAPPPALPNKPLAAVPSDVQVVPPSATADCKTLEPTARLAGFAAAHAIWSISEGKTLVTFLVHESAKGERGLDRLALPRIEESVAYGRELLTKNDAAFTRAALAFDGYVTLPDGKIDAVLIEAREYANGVSLAIEIGVPYRTANAAGGFAVHRAKILKLPTGFETCRTLLDTFWNGVESHNQAAVVWKKHFDPSR
jgi:hypothetical protein